MAKIFSDCIFVLKGIELVTVLVYWNKDRSAADSETASSIHLEIFGNRQELLSGLLAIFLVLL